jgi:hypothetical protein
MSLREKVVIGLVLLFGVGAFALAGLTGGEDRSDILIRGNAALEGFVPFRGEEVQQQHDVALLLAPGWRGEIITINDTPIPFDEQMWSEALNSVTFTPGIGKVLERLKPDSNKVLVEYWNIAAGRADSQRIGWEFSAS